jgi:hypothetical protein
MASLPLFAHTPAGGGGLNSARNSGIPLGPDSRPHSRRTSGSGMRGLDNTSQGGGGGPTSVPLRSAVGTGAGSGGGAGVGSASGEDWAPILGHMRIRTHSGSGAALTTMTPTALDRAETPLSARAHALSGGSMSAMAATGLHTAAGMFGINSASELGGGGREARTSAGAGTTVSGSGGPGSNGGSRRSSLTGRLSEQTATSQQGLSAVTAHHTSSSAAQQGGLPLSSDRDRASGGSSFRDGGSLQWDRDSQSTAGYGRDSAPTAAGWTPGGSNSGVLGQGWMYSGGGPAGYSSSGATTPLHAPQSPLLGGGSGPIPTPPDAPPPPGQQRARRRSVELLATLSGVLAVPDGVVGGSGGGGPTGGVSSSTGGTEGPGSAGPGPGQRSRA